MKNFPTRSSIVFLFFGLFFLKKDDYSCLAFAQSRGLLPPLSLKTNEAQPYPRMDSLASFIIQNKLQKKKLLK